MGSKLQIAYEPAECYADCSDNYCPYHHTGMYVAINEEGKLFFSSQYKADAETFILNSTPEKERQS